MKILRINRKDPSIAYSREAALAMRKRTGYATWLQTAGKAVVMCRLMNGKAWQRTYRGWEFDATVVGAKITTR